MKKYIQPAIETDDVLTLEGMMELTASDETVGGGGGEGDAKHREVEEKNGWEDGLW